MALKSRNPRLIQQVSDGLDDLYDNLEYNFGKMMLPSEIKFDLTYFSNELAEGWEEWYNKGDEPWA